MMMMMIRCEEKIIISPIKGASKGLKVRVLGDKKIGAEKITNGRSKKKDRAKGNWKKHTK